MDRNIINHEAINKYYPVIAEMILVLNIVIPFLLVFSTDTMYFVNNDIYRFVFYGLFSLTILILAVIFLKFRMLRITFSLIVLFLSLMFITASSLLNHASLSTLLIQFSLYVVSYLSVTILDIKKIAKNFCIIIVSLSAYSIVIYLIHMMKSSSLFFTFENNSRYIFDNYIFAFMRQDKSILARSYSIFWEPGVFQVYINCALGIVLFSGLFSARKKLVLSLTLLAANMLTFSTTGYAISGLIIVAFFIFLYVKHRDKRLLLVMGVGAGTAIAIISLGLILDYQPIVQIFSKFNPTKYEFISFLSRLESISFNWNVITQNPLLGIGPNHVGQLLEEYAQIKPGFANTNTILSMGSYYGFPLMILVIVGIIKFSFLVSKSYFVKCIVLAILLFELSAVPLMNSFLFHFILFAPTDFIPTHFNHLSGKPLLRNKQSTNEIKR